MRNIKLTTNGERDVLVNWNNVDYAKTTVSNFGDEYVEIHCGKVTLDVKESLEEIELLLSKLK